MKSTSLIAEELREFVRDRVENAVPVSDLTPSIVRLPITTPHLSKSPSGTVTVKTDTTAINNRHLEYLTFSPERSSLRYDDIAIIYFHGGGFVKGFDGYEPTLSLISDITGLKILAPKYRLAPEHPFPAAIQDANAFARWTLENRNELGFNSIGLIGDSAGGNLVANLCSIPNNYLFAILIYPWLDLTHSGKSYRDFSTGFGLSTEKLEWYRSQYAGSDSSFELSPIFSNSLKNFPKTFIGTAECDVVRDDGKGMSERLRDHEIDVVYKEYKGMVHGFLELSKLSDTALDLHHDIADFINRDD